MSKYRYSKKHNKAKINKQNKTAHVPKIWTKPVHAVFTRASVAMRLQYSEYSSTLYSVCCRLCILYTLHVRVSVESKLFKIAFNMNFIVCHHKLSFHITMTLFIFKTPPPPPWCCANMSYYLDMNCFIAKRIKRHFWHF